MLRRSVYVCLDRLTVFSFEFGKKRYSQMFHPADKFYGFSISGENKFFFSECVRRTIKRSSGFSLRRENARFLSGGGIIVNYNKRLIIIVI